MASGRVEETDAGDYVATFGSFTDAMHVIKEHEDMTNFRFVTTRSRKYGT